MIKKMTKKKRHLRYTVTLPDHTDRVFSTKQEIYRELGIWNEKINRSIIKNEWVYARSVRGWIKVTVKEVE